VPEILALKGQKVFMPPAFKVTPLKEGDIFSRSYPGGGGYGDPLKRDPHKVLDDVVREAVSKQMAEKCYGVILKGGNSALKIDDKGTNALRREMMLKRRKKGVKA
jgi:N-methylhydantoinase B/oxoprolinase/acetone carboxylase alpha subunit